ncbi:MAG: UTP--glucose-1-phosphate uridylyltransferase [Spirochaetota bacterium]|nr:MAG: UTP--glucose-1-phosphate uridylyltransferase [Spirochaetota bacterium]
MKKGRTAEEQKIVRRVEKNGQQHLFQFWDELTEYEKDILIKDIQKIDFELFKIFLNLIEEPECKERDITLPTIITVPETDFQRRKEREAYRLGCELISMSKLAVFTAAGGQSSRLGLEYPKGAYPVTPIKKKSLFQVHAEKILYMQRRFDVKIPWIIMVSETNKEQTEEFFNLHDSFGLDKKYVRFIQQGMFPAFDRSGKIFLQEKNRVFLSPSGHGGTFSALKDSGAISWLARLGVEEIFYHQVDNVLVKILDPVFIGYHVINRCGMSSKCVMKKAPKEKVGVFAEENGRKVVIEYTELENLKNLRDGLGAESFTAGNIAIHIINIGFAKKLVSKGLQLPFHMAFKAVPYVDGRGRKVVSESPNGHKVETFIFDALRDSKNSIIMEIIREEEFSPLKNKSGDASPDTVERDQICLYANWLVDAGIEVPKLSDGKPRYKLEVSPLYAPFKEDFLNRVPKNTTIDEAAYFE